MTQPNKYGAITVGVSGTIREIPIKEFLQGTYTGNRTISCAELVDNEGFVLSVENPKSSGRADQTTMWLSLESMVNLLAHMTMFLQSHPELDLNELFKNNPAMINYSWSENIGKYFEDNSL